MGRGHALAVRLAVVVVTLALAPAASGQDAEPGVARRAALEAHALARGGEVVALWDFRTGAASRLAYSARASSVSGSPTEVARAVLTEASDVFEPGVTVVTEPAEAPKAGVSLVLVGTQDLGLGRTRVDWKQVVAGIPVHGGHVQIELESTALGHKPVTLVAHYHPGIAADVATPPDAHVESGLAARFPDFDDGRIRAVTTHSLVIAKASSGDRLAWAVRTLVQRGESFLVLVDARTGDEISRSPLTCFGSAQGLAYDLNPQDTPRTDHALPNLYVQQGSTQVTTDAAGKHTLTGTVSLPNGMDGPLVRIFVDGEQEIAETALAADFNLQYDETTCHQDEVAAFYHCVSYNAYMQKTYPQVAPSANVKVPVVTRFKQSGQPYANAFYSPTPITIVGESFQGYVALGTFNGHEAARSSTVARHEYTHGLLQNLANLYGTEEALGVNEGLADYFPCVQAEDPHVGEWVVAPEPYIRDLSQVLVWPTDDNGDPHRVGNIFAGALWEARTQAEKLEAGNRLKVDQAVFGAVLRFPPVPTLLEARQSVLDSDAAIHQGAFSRILEQAFADHGIGPPPAPMTAPAPSPSPSPVATPAPSPAPTPTATNPGTTRPHVTPGTTNPGATKPGTKAPGTGTLTAASTTTGPAAVSGGSGGSGGGCELTSNGGRAGALWPVGALLLALVVRRRRGLASRGPAAR